MIGSSLMSRIRWSVGTAALWLLSCPLASAAETEIVENPYGLEALWKQGDLVARGTLFILVLLSMATWYILVTKLVDQAKLFKQAKAVRRGFWKHATLEQATPTLDVGNPFRYIAEEGLKARLHHEGEMTDQIDLNSWISMTIQRAVDRIASRLTAGLAVLATVGSTAPFIGLFGTVWGIYHALTAIALAGQASIDKVAGPVGEALIMTAIGLAVAVPAVLGYNLLVRRNKAALEQVRNFAADVHGVLLSGGRIPATKQAASSWQ